MSIIIGNEDGLGFIFCISQGKVCREENVMVSKIAYLTGKKECISIICLIKDRRKRLIFTGLYRNLYKNEKKL